MFYGFVSLKQLKCISTSTSKLKSIPMNKLTMNLFPFPGSNFCMVSLFFLLCYKYADKPSANIIFIADLIWSENRISNKQKTEIF